MRPALSVDGLVKRYGGRTVVDGVTFSADAGTVVALLGRNGAGKTTTVECIEGFRRPDAGRIRVLGADPHLQPQQVAATIGVMLQEGGAYQAATPREMLRLYAALYPRPRGVDEVLDLVDLAAVAHQRYRTLSGGEKQRVNLALALVGAPRLLFLDEPTAGMDPAARLRTWEVLRRLRNDGAGVLLTTHNLDEAEQLADLVGIIHAGRLVAFDSPQALVSGPPRVTVTTPAVVDTAALSRDLGVPAHGSRPGQLVIEAGQERLPDVAAWFSRRGHPLSAVTAGGRTLEEVFLELTGQ